MPSPPRVPTSAAGSKRQEWDRRSRKMLGVHENSFQWHDHANLPNDLPNERPNAKIPDIDVVIAIHSTSRPLQRAVESCSVDRSGPIVRVTVVCHNISALEILQTYKPIDQVIIRFLELHDGRNSPAGPKNAGLDAATAPYICMLDSDDYLEPGP